MGTQTEPVRRQEVCPACSQEFPSAEMLEEHQLTHL
jgi:transcriptional regulator NrdR family protein